MIMQKVAHIFWRLCGKMDGINDLMTDFSGSLEQYWKELSKRIASIIKKKWKIAARDRGMGRVDYAVIVTYKKKDIVLFECLKEIAKHVCELQNKGN